MRCGLEVKHTVVSTRFGWVVIGGSERGLSFVSLPRVSREAALAALEDFVKGTLEASAVFGDLPLRLQRYFDGALVTFPDKLDFGEATAFERVVWDATRSIPYGEVRSYAWVARQIGKPRACRAVGGAMARNRCPIIVPCHRVVASNGSLCGFGGGLELKRRLLDLEAGQMGKPNSPFLQ